MPKGISGGFDTYRNYDWMNQKIVVEENSYAKIAQICNTSYKTISFWTERLNIKVEERAIKYQCKECKREFLIKKNGYSKKYCPDCNKKREKTYQKKYQPGYWNKNRENWKIDSLIYRYLHKKGEGKNYWKENCKGDIYKAKKDFYQLLIFSFLIVNPIIQFCYLMLQYSKKGKLYVQKQKRIELKEKQRKEKCQKEKEVRDRLKLEANGDKKEYQRLLFNYNMNNAYKRNKKDLFYRLNLRMSRLIYYSLKQNKAGKHWEDLMNFNLEELKEHLQKTMPQGYTWEDFQNGNKLHIDHIIPQRAFIFNSFEDEEFKMCWSLHNLRLLTKKQNIKKNRYFYDNPILLWLLLKRTKILQLELQLQYV